MMVELTAGRVIAPGFDNTLYTWTSLIGVVLVALSADYYVGGRLACRYPTPGELLRLASASPFACWQSTDLGLSLLADSRVTAVYPP